MSLFYRRKFALLCLTILIAGCSYFVSWEDASRPWIGESISRYIDFHGQPTAVRELGGDVKEYKFALPKVDPRCVHYWIVNQVGVIVDFRYEGRCRVI